MKLFGTDGIRGKFGEYPINAEGAKHLGQALVTFLNTNNPKIVVGRDTRGSGPDLEAALVEGITSAGGDALLIDILPSNAVSYAIQQSKADAGVMISASHNPADDNGFKFFRSDGLKINDLQQEKIESLVENKDFAKGEGHSSELTTDYIDFLAKSTGSLQGLYVMVDAGNGAASGIAEEVLKKLGADVVVINNNPDGSNINKNSGALNPEQLQKAVMNDDFQVGIAFDGDADRLIIVDDTGFILDGDQILALLASHLKEQGKLHHNTIVVTEYSSAALDAKMKELGINVERVDVGDRHVSNALFSHHYSLGGEKSGHVIISDIAKTADAFLVALQVLKIMTDKGKSLSQLTILDLYPQVQVNVDVKEKRDLATMPKVQIKITEAENALEGHGRVFIRYSGTENKLRILIEGEKQEDIKAYADSIASAVKEELQ